MSLQAKPKLCSCCGTLQKLWKANPPMCKNCYGRNKQAELDGAKIMENLLVEGEKHRFENPPHFKTSTLKTKPKPTINGKPIYVAIYMAAFGYGDADFIPSELSGLPSVDLHHVICRGAGGTKKEDRVENLIALTRAEHEKYGDKKHCMSFLFERHRDFMLLSGVKFDMNWIEEQITKWKEDERRN